MPFAKPCLSEEAISEVVDSLRSGWLTTGPKVKKFEGMLENYIGSCQVSALSSATAGLHLALLLCNLKPGDEVITTAFTFVATLNTIVLAGGHPVLVDIEPGTYAMRVQDIESKITPRTRAIVPVHFAGAPVDLDVLYALAKKYNLRVIEDAAHAIGTAYKGKKIGSFGDIQVFSFHPNKNITTGEGGAIALRDPAELSKINSLKFHGIDREAWNRFSKTGSQLYDVTTPGFKYNMMDIQAALGIHQLPHLDSFTERRTHLAKRYLQLLSDWPQLNLPTPPSFSHQHAWDLFAVTLNPNHTGVSRDEFIEKMKNSGIGVGLHWQAPHLFSYYRSLGYKPGDFPVAENVAETIASLPLFPEMTEEQQDLVVHRMKEILKENLL